MQIVYLSARPEIFRSTILQVQRFMPFVDRVVIACPGQLASEFASLTLPLTLLHDEDLLGSRNISITDHQKRNFLLRAALVQQNLLADTFLFSDDDARPMRPISKELFVENGRYHSYYFYDLALWLSNKTDFDHGQHNTCRALSQRGYPHLSYASHMPQIIDRECFQACLATFPEADYPDPLCEWTLYFNFSQREFPQRFHAPRPYLTFCWPDAPYTWPLYVTPTEYYFENSYLNYYRPGGIFSGLTATPRPDESVRINLQKFNRWQRVADARLRGRPLLVDPWVQGSRLRWLATRIALPFLRRVPLDDPVTRFVRYHEQEQSNTMHGPGTLRRD